MHATGCLLRVAIIPVRSGSRSSWLSRLLAWYWSEETGYAIPERSGVVRYFVRLGDKLEWANKASDLHSFTENPDSDIKSFTFINSKIEDNKILMARDPGYIGNLRALPEY